MTEATAREWISALDRLAVELDKGEKLPEHVKQAVARVNAAAARAESAPRKKGA